MPIFTFIISHCLNTVSSPSLVIPLSVWDRMKTFTFFTHRHLLIAPFQNTLNSLCYTFRFSAIARFRLPSPPCIIARTLSNSATDISNYFYNYENSALSLFQLQILCQFARSPILRGCQKCTTIGHSLRRIIVLS